MKQQKMSKRKKRTLMVVALLVLISVGYAALTATLTITGKADVKARSFDVHFNNVDVTVGEGNTAIEKTKAAIDENDNTTVNFKVQLNGPGDEYEFTVDAVNSGDIDAMITSVTPISLGSAADYLQATVTYADGTAITAGQGLDAQNTHTYKVNVKYKNDDNVTLPAADPETISMSFSVEYKKNDGTATDPFPAQVSP